MSADAHAGEHKSIGVERCVQALWVIAVVGCALWLRLPGLQAGLHSDDYVQHAMRSGAFPAPRSDEALYDFGGRTHGDSRRLRAFGFFPWWSAPGLEIAMFRPLSSALVAADDAFAARDPALRHAHSALWLIALLLGAAALFAATLPRSTALLALLLLAVDPCLSVPLAWLPNRAALVSAACSVWGLFAYVRFCRHGCRACGLAAALAFAAAVLGGEYALPSLVFVFGYEWLLSRQPLRWRARRVALVLAPAALSVLIGIWLGYGTRASGLYVSPLLEPLRYAARVPARTAALAGELLYAIPARQTYFAATMPLLPGESARVVAEALFAIALAAWIACWLAMHASAELRWFGVSALLALPLLAGALPEARLLVPIAFGFDAALAGLLVWLAARALGRDPVTRRARVLAGALGVALLGVQLGVKPVRAFEAAASLRARAAVHTRWALSVRADDARTPAQQWIVIAARDFTTAEILPFARAFYGLPMPHAYRVLSTAPFAHELFRLDRYTLELRVLGGALPGSFAGSLQRSERMPFAAGDQAAAGDLRVHIEEVRDGQPTRMRFVFAKPLDDPEYLFLYPGPSGLQPVDLPDIGGRMRLAPPRTP